MIPVGEEQKPVLEYIIRLFKQHEITDIVVLAGYKHQQIRNYFNEGARFGVELHYVLDAPEYKGSAGAIVNALLVGAVAEEEILVIYYGDILSNFNLREMVNKHIESKAGATVALARGFKVRLGTAEVKDDYIIEFHEKPELEEPVSVGILVLSSSAIKEMIRLHDMQKNKSLDLMGDVIPQIIKGGIPVRAYFSDAFWYDLGSLERYERYESEGLDKLMKS